MSVYSVPFAELPERASVVICENLVVFYGAVKKGDAVIVLEAMKMENVLKAAGDAVVGSIAVQKGASVEKNQVLIMFE